jgi:hypothetical protein
MNLQGKKVPGGKMNDRRARERKNYDKRGIFY